MDKLSPPVSIPDYPVFHGFDIELPWMVPGYRRGLPHLRLEGATYFVTFRLADSIPESTLRRWREEREAWLRGNDIDSARLECDSAADMVAALEFFHEKRVWTGDFVVMPNHVHVIVQPFLGVRLEEWLYSVKRFSSTALGKEPSLQTDVRDMMRDGHLWQAESFDRIVRDAAELARTRLYMANNPARLRPSTFVARKIEWLDEFVE